MGQMYQQCIVSYVCYVPHPHPRDGQNPKDDTLMISCLKLSRCSSSSVVTNCYAFPGNAQFLQPRCRRAATTCRVAGNKVSQTDSRGTSHPDHSFMIPMHMQSCMLAWYLGLAFEWDYPTSVIPSQCLHAWCTHGWGQWHRPAGPARLAHGTGMLRHSCYSNICNDKVTSCLHPRTALEGRGTVCDWHHGWHTEHRYGSQTGFSLQDSLRKAFSSPQTPFQATGHARDSQNLCAMKICNTCASKQSRRQKITPIPGLRETW